MNEEVAWRKANALYHKADQLVKKANDQAKKLRAQARKLQRPFLPQRPRYGTRAYFRTEEEFQAHKKAYAEERAEYWNQFLSCSECSAERGKPCRDVKNHVKQTAHFMRDYNPCSFVGRGP